MLIERDEIDLREWIKEEISRIERALQEESTSHHEFINQVSEYVLFSGGKRLRPLLFVLSAKASGVNQEESLYRTSLLFEYLHTATLLHDDVVDYAEFRRGRRAARKIWGNQATVLVGDYLYAKALCLASRLGSPEVMEVITKTTLLMSKGEVIQLLNFDRMDMTVEDYFKVIYCKTAALMAASCTVGGIVAQAAQIYREALSNFGRDLGLAFQIVDDILDYTSLETGKDLGRDFFEGKVTLPLIIALQRLPDPEREKLKRLLTKTSPSLENFLEAKEIIEKTEGFTLARKMAKELIEEAKSALGVFPPSLAKSALIYLSNYLLDRRS